MGIIINELTVETTGNIVKNNIERGGQTYSVLRMTQDQARELNHDLTEFFARQDATGSTGMHSDTKKGATEAGIQHDSGTA